MWIKPVSNVKLSTTVPSCKTYNGGPIFVIKDDERGKRQFAFAAAARAAGRQVTVSLDDVTMLHGEWCYLRYIDF
jgi:hypothetical protein